MEEKSGNYKMATFSGGCFWCMQPPFDNLPGVVSTTVGYTGGKEKNPSYHDVCYGRTDHLESIEVVYDPDKVSYEQLLDVFFQQVTPLLQIVADLCVLLTIPLEAAVALRDG